MAKYIPDIPLGSYYSEPMWVYNKAFWQGLTDEQRGVLLEESGAAFIRSAVTYLRNTEEALERGQAEQGVELVAPDAELQERHERFVREDADNLLQLSQELYGVTEEQASELISTFQGLVAEWEARLDGVAWDDEETLSQIFVEEIYKKVDPATFGM